MFSEVEARPLERAGSAEAVRTGAGSRAFGSRRLPVPFAANRNASFDSVENTYISGTFARSRRRKPLIINEKTVWHEHGMSRVAVVPDIEPVDSPELWTDVPRQQTQNED